MSKSEHDASSSRDRPAGKASRPAKPSLKLRLFHLLHLARRPMTLGVRALAFDGAGRLFLVRHTYLPGWHLPGGGVDPGETAEDAVARELMEEGGLTLSERPRLVSAHFNRAASRRDHVLVYLCRGVRQEAAKAPDLEIAESGFFAPDALPVSTTQATLRRLAEHRGEALPDPDGPDPDWPDPDW